MYCWFISNKVQKIKKVVEIKQPKINKYQAPFSQYTERQVYPCAPFMRGLLSAATGICSYI